MVSAVIAVLVACGPDRSQETAPEQVAKDSVPSTGATVLFVGTSLTAGLGLDQSESFPALLQARVDSLRYPFRLVNAGVSGETSAGALRRLDWLLQQEGVPAVVVLETGANDGLRGIAPDSVMANLEAILNRLSAIEPRPVIVVAGMEAMPNLGAKYINRFRTLFPRVARDHGAYYLPFLLDGVAGNARFNQPDGIHPNAEGSRRVAENVWRVLGPVLDSLISR